MGHFDLITKKPRTLDMKDISELCVLGILFDDMRTENGIVSAVRSLDFGTWQPVRDIVTLTLERLLDAAYVDKLEVENEMYFSITGSGIKRFFSLIKYPLPYDMHVRSNSIAMKSYFVETIPKSIRKCVVDELVGYYNCQLCALQDGCGLCPLNSQRQERVAHQQTSQITQEIYWLESLT